MLENSGKVYKSGSTTIEIIDVARSRENGIGRMLARFRCESRRGQKVTHTREEITFREDLGWAIEKYRFYALADGKEHLSTAFDLTYDLRRGPTVGSQKTRLRRFQRD